MNLVLRDEAGKEHLNLELGTTVPAVAENFIISLTGLMMATGNCPHCALKAASQTIHLMNTQFLCQGEANDKN